MTVQPMEATVNEKLKEANNQLVCQATDPSANESSNQSMKQPSKLAVIYPTRYRNKQWTKQWNQPDLHATVQPTKE
jgi:hypothetical protein